MTHNLFGQFSTESYNVGVFRMKIQPQMQLVKQTLQKIGQVEYYFGGTGNLQFIAAISLNPDRLQHFRPGNFNLNGNELETRGVL